MLQIAPYVLQRQNGSDDLRNRHKKWTTDKKNSDKSEQKARFHSEKPVISSATLNLISPIDPHHGARIAGFHGRVDQWYQRSQSKPITAERGRDPADTHSVFYWIAFQPLSLEDFAGG